MSTSTPHEKRHLRRSLGVPRLLTQSPKVHYPVELETLPLETEALQEKLGAVLDQFHELEKSMTQLHKIHGHILDEFNESFASLIYGLLVTMWCVNFPHCPLKHWWEKRRDLEGVDSRLEDLQQRLEQKRAENADLKQKVALLKPKQSAREAARARRPWNRPPARRSVKIQPPGQYGSDDTYTSNDSFVDNPRASRIPQPIRARPATVGMGPNLNQPPRYLRDMYERTERGRVVKPRAPIKSRPPFR